MVSQQSGAFFIGHRSARSAIHSFNRHAYVTAASKHARCAHAQSVSAQRVHNALQSMHSIVARRGGRHASEERRSRCPSAQRCRRIRARTIARARFRSCRAIPASLLRLRRCRRSAKPRHRRSLRRRDGALANGATLRAGQRTFARLQPDSRTARLALGSHRHRDRQRRHAVPGGLGFNGREPSRPVAALRIAPRISHMARQGRRHRAHRARWRIERRRPCATRETPRPGRRTLKTAGTQYFDPATRLPGLLRARSEAHDYADNKGRKR